MITINPLVFVSIDFRGVGECLHESNSRNPIREMLRVGEIKKIFYLISKEELGFCKQNRIPFFKPERDFIVFQRIVGNDSEIVPENPFFYSGVQSVFAANRAVRLFRRNKIIV